MGAGGRMDAGRRGLHECEHVLKTFLADNAARHLVSIVPIEFPLEPLAEGAKLEVRTQGTQELIVMTADRGGWPKVSDLEVAAFPCVEEQEGKPTIPDPQTCIQMITKFTTAKTVSWISLSGPGTELDPTKEDLRPRTIRLLRIAQTDDSVLARSLTKDQSIRSHGPPADPDRDGSRSATHVCQQADSRGFPNGACRPPAVFRTGTRTELDHVHFDNLGSLHYFNSSERSLTTFRRLRQYTLRTCTRATGSYQP